MIKRLIAMVFVLVVVFGGLYAFNTFRATAIKAYFAGHRPPPTPVETTTATRENVPRRLPGIGTLAARQQVTVAPQVAGKVIGIFFDSGDTVKAGQKLVQLDDSPETADLANFQAQLRLAQANFTRSAELAKRDFAAQQVVDQNTAAVEQAKAGIQKAQATIAQKLITAPFGGVLGIRQIDLGQYLNPGGAVVTLTDLDTLHVNFTVPEQARSRVKVGQAVELTVDAFPGRVFQAKLSAIEPQIDPNTRTIKLQATMDNPGHILMPGMFAQAAVVLPPTADAVTLPDTAVTATLYGDSVFVVRQDGETGDGKPRYVADRTVVTAGTRFGSRVEIVKGLDAGAQVVISGQNKLNPGAEVVPTQASALVVPKTPSTD